MSAIGEWWDSVSTLGRGTWGNVWDVTSGKADAESKRIDDALAADNRRRLEKGMIDAAQYDARELELVRQRGSDYRADTAEEFVTGLEIGAAATAEAVNKGTGAVVGGTTSWLWRALNWKVLVLVGLYLAWQTGALAWGLAAVRSWIGSKTANA